MNIKEVLNNFYDGGIDSVTKMRRKAPCFSFGKRDYFEKLLKSCGKLDIKKEFAAEAEIL